MTSNLKTTRTTCLLLKETTNYKAPHKNGVGELPVVIFNFLQGPHKRHSGLNLYNKTMILK